MKAATIPDHLSDASNSITPRICRWCSRHGFAPDRPSSAPDVLALALRSLGTLVRRHDDSPQSHDFDDPALPAPRCPRPRPHSCEECDPRPQVSPGANDPVTWPRRHPMGAIQVPFAPPATGRIRWHEGYRSLLMVMK